MKHHLAPILAFAVLAAVLIWPAPLHLGAVVPGSATSDVYDHLWGYWWFGHELVSGRLPVRTTLSHWPDGGVLWFVDPVGATFSLPFQVVGGPAVGLVAATWLQLFGAMVAAYAAAWAEVRARSAALLAGVIFGASPYALSLLYSGTLEFLTLAPLPLFWMWARRALLGERRATVLAAGAWAWATLGNFYYAAFCVLLLGVRLWQARGGGRSVVAALFRLGVAYAVFAGPFLAVAAWTLTSPDAVVNQASAPGWNYQSLPATDLLTFVHWGAYYFPDNAKMGNHGIIHVNYLGIPFIVLTLVGALRRRELRTPLVLCTLLALGPTLAWNGAPVFVGHTPLPLPDTLLYLPGSPFRLIHHPYRLVVLPLVVGSLAAAWAVAGRPRLAAGLTVMFVAETLLVSPAVWPLPTASATVPDAYRALAADDTVTGVFDFPPNYHTANRWYQVPATVHGKPIPYGVNQFLPDEFADNHLVRTLMQCLRRPSLATIPREGGRPLEAFLRKPDPAKVDAGRQELLAFGYNAVVLHDELSEKERQCALAALGGAPTKSDGLTVVRLDAVRNRTEVAPTPDG